MCVYVYHCCTQFGTSFVIMMMGILIPTIIKRFVVIEYLSMIIINPNFTIISNSLSTIFISIWSTLEKSATLFLTLHMWIPLFDMKKIPSFHFPSLLPCLPLLINQRNHYYVMMIPLLFPSYIETHF